MRHAYASSTPTCGAYQQLLRANKAVPSNDIIELQGGALLMAKKNFEIVK
jgi:hypothetical protein